MDDNTRGIPFQSLIPKQNEVLGNEQIVRRTRLSDNYESLQNRRSLGSGINGDVTTLRNKSTNQIVAMKQIPVSDSSAREITLHYMAQADSSHAGSKYITKISDIYINRCRNQEYFYLLMEVCEGGELFDAITGQHNRHFNERQVASIVRQIASALYHLHMNLGIAHRDIKPENILLVSKDPTIEPEIRLTDFGFAKQAKDMRNQDALKSAVYTPYYVAPDILANNGKYDVSVDIWSLGVVLYIMLVGQPPFYSIHGDNHVTPNMKHKILTGDYQFDGDKFNKISENAKDLIKKMLVVVNRIDICQVLNHPYLLQALESFPETRPQSTSSDIDISYVNAQMSSTMNDMREDDVEIELGNVDSILAANKDKKKDKKKKKKIGGTSITGTAVSFHDSGNARQAGSSSCTDRSDSARTITSEEMET